MEDNLGYTIWELSNEWQKQLMKELKPLHLTHVQFLILKAVYQLEINHEEKTQIKISQLARTNVMMTSKVIRALLEKEYLMREVHEGDSRAFRVSTTKKGRKILRKGINLIEDFEKSFFSTLEKKKKLTKNLQKLVDKQKQNSAV